MTGLVQVVSLTCHLLPRTVTRHDERIERMLPSEKVDKLVEISKAEWEEEMGLESEED